MRCAEPSPLLQVRKLKDTRNQKCSVADEVEDDLRFAPVPGSPHESSSGNRARSDTMGSATSSHHAAFATASATASQAAHQAAHAAQTASQAASSMARNFSQRMKISPTANAVKTRFERMRAE